jgi:hypothetical protein
MRILRRGTGAIVVALLVACSGDPVGVKPVPSSSPQRTAERTDESGARTLARALALAMKKPELRAAVRDAMRASPVTEHKLVLQEFALTMTGKQLLTEGGARMGLSVDAIDNIIAELPLLDFYVPSEAQRRSWTAGPGGVRVGVAPSHRGDGFESFDVEGNGADGIPALKQTAGVTFLLQKAQRKSRRVNPQASVPGVTIEDADDGQLSGSFVEYLPDGSTKVTELAEYYAGNVRQPSASSLHGLGSLGNLMVPNAIAKTVLPPDSGGGGGGSLGPRDTTFLHDLVVIAVCDVGSCDFGHNEFEWHTYYSSNNGSTWVNRVDLRIEGVPSNDERMVDAPALFNKIRYSWEKITSDVVETDSWGDDHFTPSPIWSYGEAGKLKSEGDSRCGYPRYYGGYYDCYDPQLPFPWREVNQSMAWNPY